MDLLTFNELIRGADLQKPKDGRFSAVLRPCRLKVDVAMVAALKVDEVTAPATENLSGTTDVCFP